MKDKTNKNKIKNDIRYVHEMIDEQFTCNEELEVVLTFGTNVSKIKSAYNIKKEQKYIEEKILTNFNYKYEISFELDFSNTDDVNIENRKFYEYDNLESVQHDLNCCIAEDPESKYIFWSVVCILYLD